LADAREIIHEKQIRKAERLYPRQANGQEPFIGKHVVKEEFFAARYSVKPGLDVPAADNRIFENR